MRKQYYKICISSIVLLIVLSILTVMGPSTGLSVYAQNPAIEINAQNITIYAIDSWAEGIEIPDDYLQSFQLEVTGASNVSYKIVSGDSVTVSRSGLIEPVYETWYWNGGFGSTSPSGAEGEVVTVEADYGETHIEVTADDEVFDVFVEVIDYADVYADEVMRQYLNDNITDSMTDYEKFQKICAFIASYDYSVYHQSATSMIITGEGGDCWASTDAAVRMCEMLGYTVWGRNANKDSGAASGHRNAIVSLDGKYYILEAGYSGTAPRGYHVSTRTSPFAYRTVSGGIEVYQYDHNEENLTTLTIPAEIDGKTVVSIGEKFTVGSNLDELKELILPDTVKKLGVNSLYALPKLETVNLPSSLTFIDDYAFASCGALTEITIPASITTLGEDPFLNCTSMLNVYVDDSNANYSDIDGVLYNKLGNVLLGYPHGRSGSIIIPDTTTELAPGAIAYTPKIKVVTIPESIETVTDYSFRNCTGLKAIVLSNKTTSIGYAAFYSCSALSDVYFVGTEEEWNAITIDANNTNLTRATIHFNCSYDDPVVIVSVVYDANGGTSAPAQVDLIKGNNVTITSTKPTRSYHYFNGWNTKPDGTGTAYSSGEVLTLNESITLYAQWTPYTYNIYYSANYYGGYNNDTIPDSQTKEYDKSLNLDSSVPTRFGYQFAEWNTSSDGTGTSYAPGQSYSENATLYLYAIWNPNEYTVEFFANQGEGAPDTMICYHGVSSTLPTTTPTREGYTFNYWLESNAPDSGGRIRYPGDSITLYESIKLFASWKANTYEVVYNANGGTNAPQSQIKTHDVDLRLSSFGATREGWKFVGWNTEADGSGTSYTTAQMYTDNKPLTLYAQWEIIPVDYSLTPAIKGAASKLYEPWGLKYFASYDGDDVDKITERGVVMLKDEFYTAGMTPEAFRANENAYDFSSARDELGFEAPSAKYPNGRYTALLDEGIYSYDISAAYYALPYAVMENGQIVYGAIRNISMEQVLNSNLSSSAVSAEEKTICTCILALKESVATYYSATGIQGASVDIHAPRGSSQTVASKVMTPAESGITPAVKGAASRLIEPWGLKFTAAYTDDSRIADRGIVMLREDSYSDTYASNQDAMRLNAEAYVFTEGDETLQYVASSDRYSALLTEGISSRDISAAYYAAPFVVLNDGSYVYGTVRSISMLNILNTNLSSSTVSAEEKAVCQDIIDLYNAVKAFYEA